MFCGSQALPTSTFQNGNESPKEAIENRGQIFPKRIMSFARRRSPLNVGVPRPAQRLPDRAASIVTPEAAAAAAVAARPARITVSSARGAARIRKRQLALASSGGIGRLATFLLILQTAHGIPITKQPDTESGKYLSNS